MGGAGRLRWTAAVIAAVGALAGCGASDDTGRDRGPLRIGVASWTQGSAREVDLVRQTGVGWLREQIRWDELEPHRGDYRLAQTDRLFTFAARAGVQVLPMLYRTPRWLSRDPLRMPENVNAWAGFVAMMAARYGPGGRFWREHPRLDDSYAATWFELWNEPYYDIFATGGPHPRLYGRMVREAIRAGRRANPATRYLMAGETAYGSNRGEVRSWLDDVLGGTPGLAPLVDAVAVHPYTVRPPGITLGPRRQEFGRIADIRDTLDRLGADRAPLWITEIGWSTCGVRPPCVSEGRRVQLIQSLFSLLRGPVGADVEAVFVYQLRNFGPRDARNPEAYYGMLEPGGARTPSWRTLSAEARTGR